MKTEKYCGVVRQGVVQLRDASAMADGTLVAVTPVACEPGTSGGVLAAVEACPHVCAETVDKLERAIQAGQRAVAPLNPFDSQGPTDSRPQGDLPA